MLGGREPGTGEEIREPVVLCVSGDGLQFGSEPGDAADQLRREYQDIRDGMSGKDPDTLNRRHGLAIAAVLAQRERLETLRGDQAISSDTYLLLQEALDWRQLTVSGDEDRRIEEN